MNAIITKTIMFDYYDLVVFLRTKDMEVIVDRIENTGIFRNIVRCKFLNNIPSIDKIRLVLNPKSHLQKYTKDEMEYCLGRHDCILSQSVFYATIFNRSSKTNNIYLIDEGLSSYTGKTVDNSKRNFFNKMYGFIFGGRGGLVKGEYLNDKRLYMGEKKCIDLFNINKMNEESVSVCKIIFSINAESVKAYERKYIYLGTPIDKLKYLLRCDENKLDGTKNNAESIIESVINLLGRNQFLYRMHPVEKEEDIAKYKVDCCKADNSWELLISSININEKYLISFFSTAALTPKLLYGYEPRIIFLYKLIEGEFYNADKVVNKLYSIYNDTSKILVPNQIDDLKEMLNESF